MEVWNQDTAGHISSEALSRVFTCLFLASDGEDINPCSSLDYSCVTPIFAFGALPVCLSYKDIPVIRLRSHPTPVWPHLTLTNYICNDPISK